MHTWTPADGVLWLRLDRKNEAALAWLRESSGLDDVTLEALTAEQPRPRSSVRGTAMLVVLTGFEIGLFRRKCRL